MQELNKTYDEYSLGVPVAYIGTKPVKKDTVCRSGTVWKGFGDVQYVDPRVSTRLLNYPAVWCKPDQVERHKAELEQSLLETEADETEVAISEPEATKPEQELKPEDEAARLARLEAIQTAILSLDQANKDHFGNNGKPKIAAVRSAMDDATVTQEELTAAFAELS